MKKYFVFVLLFFGSNVFADSYAMRNPCCAPIFDWFYFGGHIGGIHYEANRFEGDNVLVLSDRNRVFRDMGFSGGIHVGYDWLFCKKVLGMVVDWDWTHAGEKVRLQPGVENVNIFIDSHVRWFTTVRARAGLVMFCDKLFYFTGGFANANIWDEFLLTSGSDILELSQEHNRFGWTAGLGAEFLARSNWTINAEVLYMRFESKRQRYLTSEFFFFAPFKFGSDLWVGRVGLNYRFSICCRRPAWNCR